ncbi:hypothetical protein [Bartonella sp. AS69XJJH]|uniref:hypothetical protein n=1 Tax=Bartonella sp. AS69XJJH TaxID=3243508 RepID=UPI0035D003D8
MICVGTGIGVGIGSGDVGDCVGVLNGMTAVYDGCVSGGMRGEVGKGDTYRIGEWNA